MNNQKGQSSRVLIRLTDRASEVTSRDWCKLNDGLLLDITSKTARGRQIQITWWYTLFQWCTFWIPKLA
jgi:hypothetical protein